MLASQFKVEFRKDGSIHDPKQVDALMGGLPGLTDLLVIAHGWNNDTQEADELYDEFLKNVMKMADTGLVSGVAGRKLGVLRVFWPSKKFADAQLIPGGGAAGIGAAAAQEPALLALLEELKRDPTLLGGSDGDPQRDQKLERAKQLTSDLSNAAAQREFVACIRSVLVDGEQDAEDGSSEFFALAAEELFDKLKQPVPLVSADTGGGAAGVGEGAAGLFGDLFDGIQAAARRIANFATYYQMKARAGAVGRGGLAQVLARVRKARPELPLHLVGHSFGGRVVTAAASTLPVNSRAVTMTLLQAAYSHNGLAEDFDKKKNDGAFRSVLGDKRISGPVLITHTKNDRAVGIAYPLASRIARDNAAALGDKNDPYGGMGRNGAQHTPEAENNAQRLKRADGKYAFARGRVYNLLADEFIKDHSDVKGVQVANAFLHAMTVGD